MVLLLLVAGILRIALAMRGEMALAGAQAAVLLPLALSPLGRGVVLVFVGGLGLAVLLGEGSFGGRLGSLLEVAIPFGVVLLASLGEVRRSSARGGG